VGERENEMMMMMMMTTMVIKKRCQKQMKLWVKKVLCSLYFAYTCLACVC